MDSALRRLVWQRADDRCEYCRLPQFALAVRFQIEHIVAKQHGGNDDAANLALACPYCNRYKGPNLSSIDPETKQLVPLFNPRAGNWDEHFDFGGVSVTGITATGRATVRLLEMKDENRMLLRATLLEHGEIP